MLLYSLLHLSGYPLGIDELRNFRQLGSRTAGHPEYEPELGIETTTGPLGQGISNAVGMALGEKILAARYNRPGLDVVDHRTWVFLGDGCLMEGISHEACSLAGTLGLGKLICFYDDNGISIDGEVHGWFTDDTPGRFRAYGWQVIPDVDGHDPAAISAAIKAAVANTAQPTLICCKTVIGFGAPNKQGSEATHGAPLGADEVAAAREYLGWPYQPFEVPDAIKRAWDGRDRGAAAEQAWQEQMRAYRSAHPELADELERRLENRLPTNWVADAAAAIAQIGKSEKALATRKDSQVALNAFAPLLPELLGGSADLTGSNLTLHDASVPVTPDSADGNYIYYGVREFGMAAIMNGLSLHGGFIPYGGTFLTFSDYARNALRMAALMRIRSILVFTHDSIGLGEDGPTHQPVEHIESLRIMPNMEVWRPCDGVETAVAWQAAIERSDGPTSLILSRQNVPRQPRDAAQVEAIRKGRLRVVRRSGSAGYHYRHGFRSRAGRRFCAGACRRRGCASGWSRFRAARASSNRMLRITTAYCPPALAAGSRWKPVSAPAGRDLSAPVAASSPWRATASRPRRLRCSKNTVLRPAGYAKRCGSCSLQADDPLDQF